ncbi:MAG: DUF4175 family protein [Pseudomonadota bacterium]
MPQSLTSHSSKPDLPDRLRRLAALARARLIWETYAPVLAIPVLALAVFFSLTWIGLFDVAGDPVRLLFVIALLGLIGRGVWQARHLRFPTQSDALRRLEQTAGLNHRPLDTLRDTAILAPELWPRHAQDAAEQSETIRKVGRIPALSLIDRYGLRIIAPLILAIALFLAFGFATERTRSALSPTWLSPVNPYGLSFEAWVDPPEYTGRPPIYAQGEGPIMAPEGSTLVVRTSGASDLPRPKWIGETSRFLTPSSLGRNSVEVRTIVTGSGVLDWRIGPVRQAFTVNVDPDLPPTIDSLDPPDFDTRDRLVLRFDAEDDYGVEDVRLEMVELSDGLEEATAFDGNVADIETPAGGFQSATGRELKLDLTRHPLAGRKVIGRLVAVDGAGQRGFSEPFYTTVPDKIFVEPLAKAIIEQRRLLMDGDVTYTAPPKERPDNDASDGTFDTYQTAWRLGRAAEPVQRAVDLIDAVTDQPHPSLFKDPVVYLGLRHVSKRLRYATSEVALDGLPEHMWSMALRAEFGLLGTALQEMQEAEAALREGIARRASAREVDTLFDRYNQAVDNYMEELRRNAEIGEPGESGGGQPMGNIDQIQELLDAIEEANRIGDTEGARRALAQLAELLENLQLQINPGAGGGEDSEEMDEELRDALEDLAEGLGEQRDLQDQTRQAERDELLREFGAEGIENTPSAEELAERQAQLESLIEGLRERLEEQGEIGQEGEGDQARGGQAGGEGEAGGISTDEAIRRALEAMGQAGDALEEGTFGDARQAQAEAIEALRDAGDSLSQQLASGQEDGESGGTDPLGRNVDGLESDNAETDIDGRDNAERAREILEELRERAADAERDQQEQDYLDRLLRRF